MNEILHVFFTFFIALDMIRYMRYPQNYQIIIVLFQIFYVYSPVLSELCIRVLYIMLLSTCEFRKSVQGRPHFSSGHKQNYIFLCTVQPYDILNWHKQNYISAFTVQPYDILKAKNTWVKSVICYTVYHMIICYNRKSVTNIVCVYCTERV
jgi:hypothetical protein